MARSVTGGDYEEGQSLEIGLAEAFGVIEGSSHERKRLRLLDRSGQELANVTGILGGPTWVEQEGEPFAALLVSDGGLHVEVKIAMDPATACTISPDGTLSGTLPGGATWITMPLRDRDRRGKTG